MSVTARRKTRPRSASATAHSARFNLRNVALRVPFRLPRPPPSPPLDNQDTLSSLMAVRRC